MLDERDCFATCIENEDCVGIGSLCFGQIGAEVLGFAEGREVAPNDFSTRLDDSFRKPIDRLAPSSLVRCERVDLADTLVVHPFAHRTIDLAV